jgi:hypothetical protein
LRHWPKGKESKPKLREPCRSAEMDDVMTHALAIPLPGCVKEEMLRAGTVLWVTPPTEFDRYVLVGDPGQNTLPDLYDRRQKDQVLMREGEIYRSITLANGQGQFSILRCE